MPNDNRILERARVGDLLSLPSIRAKIVATSFERWVEIQPELRSHPATQNLSSALRDLARTLEVFERRVERLEGRR